MKNTYHIKDENVEEEQENFIKGMQMNYINLKEIELFSRIQKS